MLQIYWVAVGQKFPRLVSDGVGNCAWLFSVFLYLVFILSRFILKSASPSIQINSRPKGSNIRFTASMPWKCHALLKWKGTIIWFAQWSKSSGPQPSSNRFYRRSFLLVFPQQWPKCFWAVQPEYLTKGGLGWFEHLSDPQHMDFFLEDF